MTSVTPQILARFHAALVDELTLRRDGNLEDPFTVAEIYQHLVPYRTHRDAIGVEINGDYEDALLRLLAGEGGYLRLDSDPVRTELQDELKRSNPNTGLFREFAALEVRMNPASVGSNAGSAPASDDSQRREPALELKLPQSEEKETAGAAVAPAPPAVTAQSPPTRTTQPQTSQGGRAMEGPDTKPARSGSPSDAGASGGPAAKGSTLSHCPDCTRPLPPRASLRFCPFCGVNVHVVPCSECGEELERSWSYCVACGTAT